MKTFVALLTILVLMILLVHAFAGQEPYKAAVCEDRDAPLFKFYLSPKVFQFTHSDTCYYDNSQFTVCPKPGDVVPSDCVPDGVCYKCPSKCKETFKSKTVATHPEICCIHRLPDDAGAEPTNFLICPPCEKTGDPGCTSLTPKGNSGWYEWVIVLPKKPEGEINLEIECAVTKPEIPLIEICAAETGESVDNNCTRVPGSYLKKEALPTITASAYPGGQNNFTPFHLTAYRNPSNYAITRSGGGQLKDSSSLQVLCGGPGARIALKACMEKTILIKWPKSGEINSLGEEETDLEAGDIIKVKMLIPTANTVDIYCGKYSVTIGGIGEPWTFITDTEITQRYDCGISNCANAVVDSPDEECDDGNFVSGDGCSSTCQKE